jgi:hypothetical protein
VPASVSFQIDSLPDEAAVVDARTGAALGTTPLHFTRPRGEGALQLRLTRAGYRPATINLSLARDDRARVLLTPQLRRPPRPSPTAGLDEL